jgi:multiple sugar transport system permease protein
MIGVIIANIWFGIPFNMMLLTGGISGLREDVYEAAKIDGANSIQRFFYLTIPMLKQTIGATLMLGIIYTFKVFALIWVMTGGGPVNATTTLPVWSYQLSFSFFDFGRGAAAANMLFIIMGIFALFYINIFGKEE